MFLICCGGPYKHSSILKINGKFGPNLLLFIKNVYFSQTKETEGVGRTFALTVNHFTIQLGTVYMEGGYQCYLLIRTKTSPTLKCEISILPMPPAVYVNVMEACLCV